MKAKFDYYIGIDPDIEKSGIAMLDVKARKFVVMAAMSFPDACAFLEMAHTKHGDTLKVCIEAGWFVGKSNYHAFQGHRAEKIAKNVGENHATGKHLFAMAEHYGMNAECVWPLKKCWKAKDGKISHDELMMATGDAWNGRTNQETRDAALIAWCHANLPIRVKAIL